MKVKKEEQKVKHLTKLSDEFLGLRDLDTGIIIDYLEKNIELREMPIEKRMKKKLLQ
jgi:hypothetical protein